MYGGVGVGSVGGVGGVGGGAVPVGHMGGGPPGMDPMVGVGSHHGMPMHGARSRSLRRSMGDVGPFGGPGGSPSKPSYMNSISQPPSARGSPIGMNRGLMSPTSARHRMPSATASARGPYGVSRSSNNSPLTLPMEHLPQSLSTSSAYGAHGFPYFDELASPGIDGRGTFGAGGGIGGRMSRRPPLRSYHSIEREPGYRDRSFDRIADTSLGARHRARDRSLDRALYGRDDPTLHGMGYRDRDGMLLDDPTMGPYGPGRVGMGLGPIGGLDPRAPYGAGPVIPPGGPLIGGGVGGVGMGVGRIGGMNDNFVMELQARLNELQSQYGGVKRELDATTQKLGSSMHSIKTFWSPELKKERAMRKEEAAKYALINDQLKILRSENQVCK